MALFQKAPATAEEAAQYGPLDINPDQVLEMDEAEWYEKVYRGEHVPQLTVRAVLMGSFLGFLLAFTNLYIGLKTGWALGVAITACILSYSIWNFFQKTGLAKSPMTILENNCMQSTASAAGYSTGGTMVSAIAALLLLSVTPENPKGEHMGWVVLATWTIFLAAFGTVLAIPLKRNMINKERLKFPSGTAAAVTLQSLYSEGDVAIKKARAMFTAAGIGAIFPILIELKIKAGEGLIAAEWHIFDWFTAPGSYKPSDWTMVWDVNPVMIAAGKLVGMRIGIYMLIGGLALIFGIGDWGLSADAFTTPGGDEVYAISKPWKAWKELGLWLGVPIMLSYGLLQFFAQWKTIVRAISSLKGGGSSEADAKAAETEVPFSWFAVLLTLSSAALIYTAKTFFDIPIHFGLLAIFMTFFLALVAARATGESDITPVGAMGKIMQLTFGTFIPSGTANLMSASITANGAGCCADLLTDLKSGYLLGANPRRQFVAQMMGILAGTAATVTGFYLLVPDATALTGTTLADGSHVSPDFPAPAAQAWKAVAEVMTGGGFAAMHPFHIIAIQWGLGIGTLCLALEMIFPKKKAWLPSATGLGLGLILPFQYPLSMAFGAFIAWIWERKNKEHFSTYMVPVAAGMIAGISLMGVLVALANTVLFAD
ncbi:MAG: OPT/YSL family transporter [Planctomycetota bacterium]|nr:OPT/YSL family transporter [Planctomycetota bacterium]